MLARLRRLVRPAREDIPLHRDPTAGFLPWMVAFMIFLAALALAAMFAVVNLAQDWESGLAGTVTVQVPGEEPGRAPEDARVTAAVEAITAQPGVARAEALSDAEQAELLTPWLGTSQAIDELPLPALIDVQLRNRRAFDPSAAQAAVGRAAPGAVLEDHQRWVADLRALADALSLITGTVVALVALALAGTVVFAARMALALHAREIDLLHTMGAPDRYIARQFQRYAAGIGLRGGAGGLLLAGLAAVGLILVVQNIDTPLVPRVSLGPWQWLALAGLPVASAAIAWIAAQVTVLRALAQKP